MIIMDNFNNYGTFGAYLKLLREQKKFSIQQLSLYSGVSAAQISRIENGLRGTPKPDTLHKLANALKTPYEELMQSAGYIDDNDYLRNAPLELKEQLSKYENINQLLREVHKYIRDKLYEQDGGIKLSEQEREFMFHSSDFKFKYFPFTIVLDWAKEKNVSLKTMLDEMGVSYTLKKNTPKYAEPYDAETMLKLPVLGAIRAGEPTDRIENIEGYTLVDPDLLRGRQGFALRVEGDSMSGDRILDGDIVIVLKQEEVESSDIAVVAIDNDVATLKRVKCEGDMCMLIPSNPAYEPKLVKASEVRIIGKVVEVKFWPGKK